MNRAPFWAFLFLLGACSDPAPLRIVTGSDPSGAVLVEGGRTLVVTAAMSSAIQFFDVQTKQLTSQITLKLNKDGTSQNPWGIAATTDQRYAAVALRDAHSVALIDIPKREQVSSTLISQKGFNHPSALKFVGDDLFVIFANFLSYGQNGEPTRYDPGTLARFRIKDNELKLIDFAALPCVNPSDFDADEQGRIQVACSGSLAWNGKTFTLHDGAALATFDIENLANVWTIKLKHFSPSGVLAHADGTYMTSSNKRQVLFVANAAIQESDAQTLPLNADLPDETGFLPSLVRWSRDIALVTDFKDNQIHGLQLSTRTFNPKPFDKPLRAHDSRFSKGPKVILLQEGENSENLLVVMSLSAEVLPVKVTLDAGN